VRGVSMINFMSMSYDRTGERPLQCRPNYIPDNPGMDMLGGLNTYAARLSHIMQNSSCRITTALYYPQRSICAGGEIGDKAARDYERIGDMLEAKGVEFDIIDEEFVRSATVENGALCGEFVKYTNVFVPHGDFEDAELMSKLAATGKSMEPAIERENPYILGRTMYFDDGSDALLVVNTSGEMLCDTVKFKNGKTPYIIDLYTGDLLVCPHTRSGETVSIPVELMRGCSVMLWFTDAAADAKTESTFAETAELRNFDAKITRRYTIDREIGMKNEYFDDGEKLNGLGEWDSEFSGEADYSTVLENLPEGPLALDLGEVRFHARVYLNGEAVGETIMPPYRVMLNGVKNGDLLTIKVANTSANATRNAEFFSIHDIKDVGPYHGFMSKAEQEAPAGGLIGPVKLLKVM